MQRTLIIAAALASFGAGAFAQGTVSIYGRMNVTLERQKVGTVTRSVMQNNSSRIGFKGSEDLGGGLAAGFQLEHGFNADTGTGSGAFWGRQSELNLSSNNWGMVRLGNFTSEAYFATSDYIGMHNHETGTSSDAFYAYVGWVDGVSRDTNKIAYRTPSMGGATLEGAVTLAEANLYRTFDLAANYVAGPLHLGAGYEKNGPASQFAVRGYYEMGAFTFGGYVQRDTDGIGRGLGKRTTLRLSGMYAVGKTELHANVGRAGDYSGMVGDQAANQYTLGINQNLSKRTKVYVFVTKVADSNSGLYGGDFQSLAVGLRHNF